MKKIPLTGKVGAGKFALVDDEDYNKLIIYRWNLSRARAGRIFTGTWVELESGQKSVRLLYLHRLIMNAPLGMVVDHISGDIFDNRKANLRICTSGQNSLNRKINQNNTTGYKGVYPYRSGWRAKISHQNKRYHLGNFLSKEAAALAYNEAALRLHGEFSRLNEVR